VIDSDKTVNVVFTTSTFQPGETLEEYFYRNVISIDALDKIVYPLTVGGRKAIAGSATKLQPLYFYEIEYENGKTLSILASNLNLVKTSEEDIQRFRDITDAFVQSITFK
jgi:hypothetical protein